MKITIHQDYEQLSIWAANYIAGKINRYSPTKNKPFVLGLPTGSSPVGVYKNLVKLYSEGKLSFQNVVTFNLDEYVGIPESHPQSFHFFMNEHLFNKVDIQRENINILNGNASDPDAECIEYENKIKSFGGIRLFLGGIGTNGHLAFNEPGSSLKSKTRIEALAYDTIVSNARFFDNDVNKVPRYALTVGIGTIMEAEEILIIVCGYKKAGALQKIIEDGVNHMWPASALQFHPKVLIVCDEEATRELDAGTIKYFREIGANKI